MPYLQPITLPVRGCARCGNDHGIRFEPLETPVFHSGYLWEYQGQCHIRDQPVLMRFATTNPDITIRYDRFSGISASEI